MAQISLLQVTVNDITYATDVTTLTTEQIAQELEVLIPELTSLQNLQLETDEEIVAKYKKLLDLELNEMVTKRRVQLEMIAEKSERVSLLEALQEQIMEKRKEKGLPLPQKETPPIAPIKEAVEEKAVEEKAEDNSQTTFEDLV
jgi:hypothetical protein